MKKKPILTAVLLAVTFILELGGTVSANNYKISHAIEMLSEDICLRKCTVMTRELTFTREDFEQTLGTPIEYITVTSLPESSVGVLKYAGGDVDRGQAIPAKNLSLLKFMPGRQAASTSFGFSADGSEELCAECSLEVLEKRNYAPYGSDLSASAISGIGLVKSLDVYDPDGDSISVEITGYPENGVVKLCGTGFVYTALPNFSGNDGFTYNVVDSFGNISRTASVKMDVRKARTDVRYADMAGHWGYTSAIAMTESGLMRGTEKDGKLCFEPDAPISRGDFLAMAMISAGLEEKIVPDASTAFADDTDIPSNIRSYASYAQAGGMISGYADGEGRRVFGSDREISRAEAASVLSGILGNVKMVGDFDFVDAASIPDWAKNSFMSLVGLGIISGNPDGALEPSRSLTRAEAAQILCNTVRWRESRSADTE